MEEERGQSGRGGREIGRNLTVVKSSYFIILLLIYAGGHVRQQCAVPIA